MSAYFADTYYYLALLNPRDSAHQRAVALSAALRRPVLTTAWILIEVADALSTPPHRGSAAAFLQALLKRGGDCEVVAPSMDWLERGLQLYGDRLDKAWSLTDCISFAVMQARGLTEALTGDRHFEQAGFVPLLK